MPHAMTSDFVNTTGQVSSSALCPCRHHGDDSHGASHAADTCHTCDTCLVWQRTIGLAICLRLSAVQHWDRTGNCNFVIGEWLMIKWFEVNTRREPGSKFRPLICRISEQHIKLKDHKRLASTWSFRIGLVWTIVPFKTEFVFLNLHRFDEVGLSHQPGLTGRRTWTAEATT